MTDILEKTVAEFFAGIGLIRIGLERAGWRISLANDIEEGKWRMCQNNFGDTGESITELVPDLSSRRSCRAAELWQS